MAMAEEIPQEGWAQADEATREVARPVAVPHSPLDKGADSVGQYFKEIAKTPLLDAEEEVALAKRIEVGAFAGIILSLRDPETREQTLVSLSETVKKAGVGKGKSKENERKRTAEERQTDIDRLLYYATTKKPEIERPDGSQLVLEQEDLEDLVADGQKATDHLIKANLRLVVSVAKKYQAFMPLLDNIQEGNEGLVHAIEKFDFAKGFKFSTYATWWIRQGITRAIADKGRIIRIPVHMVEQINKTRRIERELRVTLGVAPTTEQIAKEMGVSVEKVQETLEYDTPVVSLNQQVKPDSDSSAELGDYVHDQIFEPPDKGMLEGDLVQQTRNAINRLPEREGRVLRMRYGIDGEEPLMVNTIAEILGLDRKTIRVIEKSALEHLVEENPGLKALLVDTGE